MEFHLLNLNKDSVDYLTNMNKIRFKKHNLANYYNKHKINDKLNKLNYYKMAKIRAEIFSERMTDGFFALDKKWNFIYINNIAEQIVGRPREELLGKNIWEEFPKAINTTFYFRVKDVMENKSDGEFEIYFKPQDRWFDIRAYCNINGLSIYMTDITENKKINRRKDEFISIASHELKTPITSIKAYTQIIKRDLNKRTTKDTVYYLEKIDNQTDNLTRIIESLLDMSNIKDGKLRINKNLYDINLIVKEVVEDIQNLYENYNITIKGLIKDKVMFDKLLISRVINNLLSNAIKYSNGSTKINIEIIKNDNEIILSIQDFGIGIARKYFSRIFQQYFRVRQSNKERITGLGLGLFISKRMIKNHGGRIWVDSIEGKGSKFFFSLPLEKK